MFSVVRCARFIAGCPSRRGPDLVSIAVTGIQLNGLVKIGKRRFERFALRRTCAPAGDGGIEITAQERPQPVLLWIGWRRLVEALEDAKGTMFML